MENTYINYGTDQIDLQQLLNSISNNVNDYVNSQSWSNKRKLKFMEAYSDIISKGIIGADNSSGQWALNLNLNIDLENKSKMDLSMYHEAAYFILELMQGITPQNKKEEEEKKDLPVYDYNTHIGGINDYVKRTLYGGQEWVIGGDRDNWNYLDERGENGLRDIKVRANKLADVLDGYSKTIEEGKYNFEGSAFSDLNDLKNRLSTASLKLRAGIMDLDTKDALNLIGLNWKDYFNDGSGDVADEEGHTYAELAALNLLVKEEEARQNAIKELQTKNANRGVLTSFGGIHAVEAKNQSEAYTNWLSSTYGVGQLGFNAVNNRILELLENGYSSGKMSEADKKELGNLLYYIRKNNPNYLLSNISDQDWAELNTHKNLGSTNRAGYVRLPWEVGGRYTYADDKGNIYFLKPQNLAQLAAPTFLRSAAYNNYRNNFLKSENNKALNTTIGSNNGLTNDMKADLAAMGLDLVSAGSAFVPGYGTAVSAVTGIGATLSGAVADRMRGESWGSTLGTAGFGLTMDVLGLIPGLGVAGKAAKIARIVSKGAKWVGPALGGLSAMAYGPGALSAYKKMVSGNSDDVTAEELRDFTYAIRAIAAGGIRKAGATYLGNRTLARAVKEGKAEISSGKLAASITTKNGLKINLTDDEFKTLKSNANRETKAKTITQAALREKINMEGDEIEWKGINPVKGRLKTSSKSSKLSGLKESTESSQLKWNTTSADYKGIRRFSNENLLRGFTTMSTPTSGILNRIRNRWTGLDILNRSLTLSSTIPATKESQKLLPFIKGKYNAPKTKSLEVIPISRALPLPGGEHKGTKVDIQRTGTLSTKNISTGEAVKEFTDFDRMYITPTRKNSKVPSKPIGNGYGTSKEPESGSLDFNGMTATVTKLNGDRGFSITFGKSNDTVIAQQYKDIQQLRNNFAIQLNNIIKKQNNVKETAALLRQFKAKGWLKQGGTIDKQRIQRYKEYITK